MYTINPFSFSYKASESSRVLFLKTPIVINAGETIAIAGPSGAGKSTFLKILKGIIPEFSSGTLEGEVLFDGQNLFGENFEKNLRRILYLFQNPYSQVLHPTTEEEFLFSLENFNFSPDDIKERGEKLEKIFGLEPIWGKKTKELSHGECQKLVLASLMAVDPEVLLLDEPTAFLDPKARLEFYRFLKLMKQDHSVIIVDHHLDEIKSLVDRYLWVDDKGEIREVPFPNFEEKKEITKVDSVINLALTLTVKTLSFSYEKKKPILKDLDLVAHGGEILAIKGVNGSGKSTFFKLCSGLLKPNQGSIELEVNGKSVKHSKLHEVVGLVFQNPETHFFYDTIAQELEQSFKKNKPDQSLLESFLKGVNFKKSPFLLSEGEKRRLTILMTVFQGKKLVFYDEPTFGQDALSRTLISNLMIELKNLGILQVVISHDERFIRDTADRVFLLDQGRLDVIP